MIKRKKRGFVLVLALYILVFVSLVLLLVLRSLKIEADLLANRQAAYQEALRMEGLALEIEAAGIINKESLKWGRLSYQSQDLGGIHLSMTLSQREGKVYSMIYNRATQRYYMIQGRLANLLLDQDPLDQEAYETIKARALADWPANDQAYWLIHEGGRDYLLTEDQVQAYEGAPSPAQPEEPGPAAEPDPDLPADPDPGAEGPEAGPSSQPETEDPGPEADQQAWLAFLQAQDQTQAVQGQLLTGRLRVLGPARFQGVLLEADLDLDQGSLDWEGLILTQEALPAGLALRGQAYSPVDQPDLAYEADPRVLQAYPAWQGEEEFILETFYPRRGIY